MKPSPSRVSIQSRTSSMTMPVLCSIWASETKEASLDKSRIACKTIFWAPKSLAIAPSSRIMHQDHLLRHLPKHHRPLPVAAHLAVDEVKQRIDRDLAVLGRLALQAPQQGVGEEAVPEGR